MARTLLLAVVGLGWLVGAAAASAAGLSATAEGIAVDAGTVGRFTLEYPRLGEKELAPAEKRIEGRRVALSYPGGAAITVELRDGGLIAFLPTNLPGGAKDVPSQHDRGLAYRHYVEQAAALGFVVGQEWFTLIDQARAGRFFEKIGGENGNTGLFSVADRPWTELVEAAAETHRRIYDVALGQTPPFASDLPLLQVK